MNFDAVFQCRMLLILIFLFFIIFDMPFFLWTITFLWSTLYCSIAIAVPLMMELVGYGMPGILKWLLGCTFQNLQILQLVSFLFSAAKIDQLINMWKNLVLYHNCLDAGRNSGPSSSTVQSHQIFCCAFNANGTVFVTGSSDTLARVYYTFGPLISFPQPFSV